MTALILALAGLVAVAAAVRSTWSPCGLSMLSTITPVSERAKGNSYRSTATWFIVGSGAGGATLGAALALAALGVRALHPAPTALGIAALVAALMAAGSDAGVIGRRLPIHRRQVNERWLDQYRSWVYGGGFGWQIGTGLATYITTAAVYLMVVLAILTTSPVAALAIGTGFGLLRGLAVLLNRRITDPVDLLAFHRRFFEAGPMVGRLVTTVELVVAIVLVGELAAWPVVVTAAFALGATVLAGVLTAKGGWRLAEAGVACPAEVARGRGRRGAVDGDGASGSPVRDTRRSGDPQPRSAGARGDPRAPVLVREQARPHREPMHQHQH
jgi:hypothetical protein